MRAGVRLAFDWGQARIGVAACDGLGILAYPVETIPVDGRYLSVRSTAADQSGLERPPAPAGPHWQRVAELVDEYRPIEVILGLPTDLAGRTGVAATNILAIAKQLAELVDRPVRLIDERMTTAEASKQLSAAGKSKKRQRSIIDQAAAVGILKTALAAEAAGNLPGRTISKEQSV